MLSVLSLRAARFFCASAMSCFSAFLAPLVMLLRHNGRSCAMASQEFVSILKRFNDTLRESLKLFFYPPAERLPVLSSLYISCFGIRPSGIRTTCPAHLSWAFCSSVGMPEVLALVRTSVSGTLSCHFILSSLRRQLV